MVQRNPANPGSGILSGILRRQQAVISSVHFQAADRFTLMRSIPAAGGKNSGLA